MTPRPNRGRALRAGLLLAASVVSLPACGAAHRAEAARAEAEFARLDAEAAAAQATAMAEQARALAATSGADGSALDAAALDDDVLARTRNDTMRAFVGATLIPIAGQDIPNGVLVTADGLIVAAGAAADVRVPDGAVIHDVSGQVIMPGLVDTHSHICTPFAADGSHPFQPGVRSMDAIDVRESSLQKAQAGGITTANLMPGSGHLMSGQTTYLKLRDGNVIDDLLLHTSDGRVAGGMKMANGTNSQDDPPFPGTRGKSAAIVRQGFIDAQAYGAKIDAGAAPDRNLDKEALLEVLDGRRLVHHHTHRHDDIVTVLRLQQEFGFRLVLQHVSDAWQVADAIAANRTPCSLILLDSPGGKLEAVDVAWKTAAVLEQKGVPVAFHTDDPVNDSRLFLRSAAFAVRGGMSRAGALAGVTLTAAAMLDLEHRVGSLEPGKDADFVLLDGDPLSVYSLVQETWVEGRKVFDRDDPADRLWAVGGYGAGQPRKLAGLCCFGNGEDR